MKPLFSFLFFILLSAPALSATYEEGKKAYLDKDYETALSILKPLAENGHSQAQITMGLIYDYGHGVEKDATESIRWYRMAAEQGVPLVQHDLGVKYFQGQGVKQNYQEAVRWWEMSANAGIADSQFNLGLMHYRGIGIPQDFAKAANLFEQAAEQDHGHAQYSLAVMYAFGQGKTKNYETALAWFRKSAAQGIAQAQFNLGVFHEKGYGLDQDPEKAREWYQLAADQGLQEAVKKLQVLKNTPVQRVKKEPGPAGDEDTPTEAKAVQPARVTSPSGTVNEALNLSAWLAQQPANSYTLQLASVINKNDVINYIKNARLGSSAGFIEVIVNDITRYTAVYGQYQTFQDAEQAISGLPTNIQKTKPWVRNIGILQKLLR